MRSDYVTASPQAKEAYRRVLNALLIADGETPPLSATEYIAIIAATLMTVQRSSDMTWNDIVIELAAAVRSITERNKESK